MKRRILYTLPDLHFGGAANLLAQNFSELSRDNTTFLVYFGSNSEMVEKFRMAGAEPVRISYNGIKDIVSTIRRLRNFIIDNNIEVVHTNLFLDKYLVALASWQLRVKKVTTIHSADISKYKKSFKNKILYRIDNFLHNQVYDKTIVVSKASEALAIHQRKLNPEKLHLVLNGIVPLPKIEKRIEYSDKVVFGTACRFQPIKGLPRLLRLFAKLVKSSSIETQYKMLLIGDGPEKSSILKLIIELNIENDVEFTGFTKDVPFYLNQIDYYINSSFSEAMPISILEALSIGKPIIASDVGGIPEIVENGYNGILVDFNNLEEALIKLKEFLYLSSNDYIRFSKNAEATFHEKFSSKNYSNKILQIYSD